jgi:hypothetical protein
MALTKALGGGGGSSLTVKDEGTNLSTAVASIDFVGAGVTATGTTAVTVTIPGGTASEVLITETVVGVATATFSFSSIAATYRDLRLVVRGRGTVAATAADCLLRFNGDTASNYQYVRIWGQATSSAVDANTSTTSINIGFIPGSTATSGDQAGIDCRIFNYRGTTYNKPVSANLFTSGFTNIFSMHASGNWKSTAAITSISGLLSSGNFDVGTVVSLYGIL